MNGHEQGSADESDEDLPVMKNTNGHGETDETVSASAIGATASSLTDDMPMSDMNNKRKNQHQYYHQRFFLLCSTTDG